MSNVIADSAAIYSGFNAVDSNVGAHCVVGNDCDVISSTMEPYSRIGRRNVISDSHIGVGSYTGSNCEIRGTDIGRFCNLSWNLSIGGHNHNYSAVSMSSDANWDKIFGTDTKYDADWGRTEIGNDVWIASGVSIISGVSIGDGAVIGAGATVVRDIPPYAIAVGCPARVIRYRFDEGTIAKLLSIRWWDWPFDTIKEATEYLRCDLTDDILEKLGKIAFGTRITER